MKLIDKIQTAVFILGAASIAYLSSDQKSDPHQNVQTENVHPENATQQTITDRTMLDGKEREVVNAPEKQDEANNHLKIQLDGTYKLLVYEKMGNIC